MKYKIFGPFEIPLGFGEFKRRIDKEDIGEFWSGVGPGLNNACGIYVFTIKTKSKEKPWYVGKAQKQIFEKECFTHHKIVLNNACGIYVFTIKTKSKEKPWYVGKAQKQIFEKECFTHHKIVYYHEALEKSRGTPMMYFVARVRNKGSFSNPTTSKSGHPEMDFVERSFIEWGFNKNKDIRNKKGIKNPEKLIIEGFYNHKDPQKKIS